MAYFSSIVIGSLFVYVLMFSLYLITEKGKGLKNMEVILSLICWGMSVLSFYQAAMIAEKMGVMGQSTIGDAMLSVLSLILLGKAYFYPSSKKPMKKRGMVLTLVNGNNQIK